MNSINTLTVLAPSSMALQIQPNEPLPPTLERWLDIPGELPKAHKLFGFAHELRARTGIPLSSALAIALASISAALGPLVWITNPIGAPLPSAMNVLSSGSEAAVRRAVNLSLRGFTAELEQRNELRISRGPLGHRADLKAALCELEDTVQGAAGPPKKSQPSDPIGGAAPTALRAAQKKVHEAQFAVQPWIFSERLTAGDLTKLVPASFDRALLLSPRNCTALVAEPEIIHHFLLAGWYGKPFDLAPGECCSPIVANLWIGASPDLASMATGDPLASFLATFFIARSDHEQVRLAATVGKSAWDQALAFYFNSRLAGRALPWHLSSQALEVFENACNQLGGASAQLSPARKRLVDLWPEQLLKIILLCGMISGDIDASCGIGKLTAEHALTVLRLLGREQLEHHPLLRPPAPALDPEIATLLAKLQLHGPMTPRDLSRCYHKRGMQELEPVMARAASLGLLTIINGNVQILNGPPPVSVSACQQPHFPKTTNTP